VALDFTFPPAIVVMRVTASNSASINWSSGNDTAGQRQSVAIRFGEPLLPALLLENVGNLATRQRTFVRDQYTVCRVAGNLIVADR